MKLGHIYNGFKVWERLARVPKSPAAAYALMKHFRRLAEEYRMVMDYHGELLKELGEEDKERGLIVVREGKSKDEFLHRFNEFLATECDIPPVNLTMEDLVRELAHNKDNIISEEDLFLLEPFFQQEPEKSPPNGD